MAMGGVLQSLEELWTQGQLRDLEHDLDRFLRDNLQEIRRVMAEGRGSGTEIARRRHMRGEISNNQLVDFCVRALLRKRGTCNPPGTSRNRSPRSRRKSGTRASG